MESAKARMAFVRPLVEAIIPDIQGIGDNTAKAQQSWNNGQYLSATENAGVVLVGMAENLPALKAAKAAGKVDNLLPTHIPDATTRAVQSAGSAKAAADILHSKLDEPVVQRLNCVLMGRYLRMLVREVLRVIYIPA